MTKIIIIGCGIGGATAALALLKAGHEVRVFERAPTISEVGAGIGLLPNAMRVLDALAIGQQVRKQGQVFITAEICTTAGLTLQQLKLRHIVGPDAPMGCVIHRAKLLSIILDEVPYEIISTGAECTGIDQTPYGVLVHFNQRPSEKADLVVGADGIHSIVRCILFGDAPLRYSGQTCFRGIAHHQLNQPELIREIQGVGQRASTMMVDRERVYWWAALNAQQGKSLTQNERREILMERFAGWPFGIAESIVATKPGGILQNDLVDRHPLRTWTQGRVTLLGDAAHPMVPNLGQGACSSIEDALVLSHALKLHQGDYKAAFSAYERARIKRCAMIAKMSWLYGVPCVWPAPAVALREALTKALPEWVITRTFKKILGYDASSILQTPI